eukprot:NODE_155_length_2348_cov_91.613310_g135_i0.p1 GENE.NODE_155_length_2348_cov_91.613310_g135_i0~~NODE_155_length_2348_cov_91.613310_g135_i0.p1  ORF type:complete len:527 (-),score=171.96 NODE_155_length_2348_cov_91.613310_g135_i0:112-1692(-)
MVKKETQEVITAWHRKNDEMHQQLVDATTQCERLKVEVESCKQGKEKEVDDRMNEARKRKKDRRNAEEKIEKVKAQLEACVQEEVTVSEKVRAKEHEFVNMSGQDEDKWELQNEMWGRQDERQKRLEKFLRGLRAYRHAQHELVKAKSANQPLCNTVDAIKYEVKYAEISDLIDDVLDYMIETAVENSTGANPHRPTIVSPPPRKTITSPTTGRSGRDSDEESELDVLEYEPKMRPMRQQNLHIQSNRAEVAFHHNNQTRTSYDEDEADRQYLMGIYDAENLVHDILKYLQSGTILLKHGRSGKPHFRKFALSGDLTELHWADPDTPRTRPSIVELREITGIILGQYSKVFRRNHSDMTEPEFYLSFSLMVKSGKRTIDVVAETASEFEAWLMGLSNVLKMEPRWGKPLDITVEESYGKLSKEEQDSCSKYHITPQLYCKLKDVVEERRQEVRQSIRLFDGDMDKVYQAVGGIHPPCIDKYGALLMTKGELRYLANVDIFRTCVIWKLFGNQRLIYDPDFRPPVSQ